MFYAYILKSKKDKRCYYGHTNNLDKRLHSHNSGKVKSTKHRRPLEIIYSEKFENKTEAIKREIFFKSIEGYNWLKSKIPSKFECGGLGSNGKSAYPGSSRQNKSCFLI